MPLSAGTRLGSYEIVAALGAGGMGEVYRARDTKLGRDVAIKILPELFLTDPDRVARFQREAQLLAALNHPNIAAIYGLEETEQARFLVMELVDGESLAERLAQRNATQSRQSLRTTAPSDGEARQAAGVGPRGIEIKDALAIARQIVDALEAAHDKGIVHRDLKPANIMLTADGQVKVLDFGLAKHDAGASGSSGPGGFTHSPTLTFAATQAGMILGTAAYMSPEQAKGRAADKRSDVWAFGCVLFEMLAGKRAFEGEDATDVIAAIVRGEPDWNALPRGVPDAMRTLIKRCLDKDRKARIPDMSVVRFLMADADRAPAIPAVAVKRSRSRVTLIAGAGIVAGAAAATIAWWAVIHNAPSSRLQPARFAIVPSTEQPIIDGTPDRNLAVSPDGTRIVYVSSASNEGPTPQGPLIVRAIDQLDAVTLRGISARAPFMSPDGRWIGYFDSGELKKVSTSGGPPLAICRVNGGTRGSTWGPDDTIVYATNEASTGLFSVPAAGGQPKLLTKADAAQGELDHFFPSFLPDGHTVLFTIFTAGPLENAQVAAFDVRTGRRKTLIRGGSHAEYVSSGQGAYLIYAAAGALRAVRFDPERLEVLGDSITVVDQIVVSPGSGAANFAVSRNGTLVYVPGVGGNDVARTLVWVDRRGREEPVNAPPRGYLQLKISPDGDRIAVALTDQEQDIWILDRATQRLTKLTFDPSTEQYPLWTPDGRTIVFGSGRTGIPHVFRQPADGTGAVEQLTQGRSIVTPFSISPDGKTMVVGVQSTQTGPDLGLLRLEGQPTVEPLIQAPLAQANADISPDGHWLVYQSNESGRTEIYVRPFPNVNDGRWLVSSAGGAKPLWARTGHELFYLNPVNRMMAVSVRLTPTFSAGSPTTLFEKGYFSAPPGRSYDVSPDGQKFLMIQDPLASQNTRRSMIVVLNWFEELRQRLPAK